MILRHATEDTPIHKIFSHITRPVSFDVCQPNDQVHQQVVRSRSHSLQPSVLDKRQGNPGSWLDTTFERGRVAIPDTDMRTYTQGQ
jgi:hypothetical protein